MPEHEENRFQDCTGQRYHSTIIYRTRFAPFKTSFPLFLVLCAGSERLFARIPREVVGGNVLTHSQLNP